MNTDIQELFLELNARSIKLRRNGANIGVRGAKKKLDGDLVERLNTHKAQLLALIDQHGDEWWSPPLVITPAMLPLVALTQDEIDRVVAAVPGGAGNVQDIYPLAPLQEGIFFHHLMAQEGDAYLLSSLMAFDTRARLDAFVGALQAVVDRHDILRTAIAWEGLPEPVQVVHRRAALPVEEVALPVDDAAAALRARFDPRRHRIDLRQAPMLRACIGHDAAQGRWLLLVLLHHLAGDHTALEAIGREVHAHLSGHGAALPQSVPFRNLVAQARRGVTRDEHDAFFRAMLGDVTEPTAPFGVLDVRGDGTGIGTARREVDPAVGARLRDRARRLGVTVATLCHQAWAHVLARLTGHRDVVFGTLLFGRMQGGDGADRALGLFINTLPIKISVGDHGIADGVRRTHETLAALLRHEHATLALAQRASGVAAPTPLFTTLLNVRHSAPAATGAALDWQGVEVLHSEERTNYPLTMSVDDMGSALWLSAQAHGALDAARICEHMHVALARLADALEAAPDAAARSLDVLPEAERHTLATWAGCDAPFDELLCVHELFEMHAAVRPDAVALVGAETLTYGELDARANRLAHHLRSLGVGPDALVALCAERGVEMVVGTLAVLKAGGAYLPLDPTYPPARLRAMIEDSRPVAVLVHGDVPDVFDGETVVPLGASLDTPSTPPTMLGLTPRHLAYVIFTSGSTGRPKGAMIEHRALVNNVAAQARFGLDAASRVLQLASPSFDACVLETTMALCHGAALVLAPVGAALAGDALVRFATEQRITHTLIPPAVLATIPDGADLPTVRVLLVGADAVPESAVQRWAVGGRRVINAYGPTEGAIWIASHECSAGERGAPPIGTPIPNGRVYILDDRGAPAPIGVAGELCIGGAAVARGYLHRDELSTERFVADPFRPGERMYRTGDLARWRDDGVLEFLGRTDHQVKIRGVRVELGEIETRLREHPAVATAVVIARDVAGDRRLVAYVVADPPLAAEALRAHLAATLPEPMVPAAFVALEALPLTPSGKVDRRALPAPQGDAYAARAYEEPIGDAELTIAAIWSRLLGVDRVGRHDDFFALGGHSLLAVTLVEQMRRAELPTDVRTVFAAPTLAALAARVGSGAAVAVPPNLIPDGCAAITPDLLPLVSLTPDEIERIVAAIPGGAGNVQDLYPLAPLQEGILFHHLVERAGDAYLLTSQIAFDSRARVDAFVGALQAVIDRHDILRTSIAWEGLAEPVQVVWRRAALPVDEIEVAGTDAASLLRERFDPRRYRMDLRRAPMLRVAVAFDEVQERWVALVLLHHLAGDHTTLDVIRDEIEAHLLGTQALLPAGVPFRALVAQARLGASKSDHEAFFRRLLGDVSEPTAPFDLLDVRGDGGGIAEARLPVDAAVGQRLRGHARRLGVTPASLCHLAWAQVLARLTGRDDVVFGTVLFGRMQGGAGADRGMGLFINTLPVRVSVGDDGVEAAVRSTHALLAELMRHEHATLALAQRCSGVPAPLPLFSSLLNYRHSPAAAHAPSPDALRAWGGMELLHGEERTSYPLSVSVDDVGQGFGLTAQVVSSIDPARICALLHTALERLVEALDRAPATALRDLDVLPAAERDRVLETWNATAAPLPSAGAHTWFEDHAARTPEAPAVVSGDRTLSYAELNARANRVAHRLRAMGVGADARVAIHAARGPEMVVAVLAVLKAGGAYVPLDPTYPLDRLRHMVADSAPVAVLVHGAVPADLLDGTVGSSRVDLQACKLEYSIVSPK